MENVFNQIPSPVTSDEKRSGGDNLFKDMESAKQEIQKAIRSGDVKSALNMFLRLNESLPTGRREKTFDYAGSFAKDIMREAIRAAGAGTARYEDVKSVVEVYLSLRPYFPTSHNGESFDYAGSYAKDVMREVIKAAGNGGAGDAELARKTFDVLRPLLPTEHGGKKFDYAGSYERDISRL